MKNIAETQDANKLYYVDYNLWVDRSGKPQMCFLRMREFDVEYKQKTIILTEKWDYKEKRIFKKIDWFYINGWWFVMYDTKEQSLAEAKRCFEEFFVSDDVSKNKANYVKKYREEFYKKHKV